jgi:hypothetical protein
MQEEFDKALGEGPTLQGARNLPRDPAFYGAPSLQQMDAQHKANVQEFNRKAIKLIKKSEASHTRVQYLRNDEQTLEISRPTEPVKNIIDACLRAVEQTERFKKAETRYDATDV